MKRFLFEAQEFLKESFYFAGVTIFAMALAGAAIGTLAAAIYWTFQALT